MILIHGVILLDTTSHDKNIFKEEMGQQSWVKVFWIIPEFENLGLSLKIPN